MFSERFVKDSDCSLLCKQSSIGNKQKRVGAFFSPDTDVPVLKPAVPKIVNLVPQYSSVYLRHKRQQEVAVPLPKAFWNYQNRTPAANSKEIHQPLLRKRCNSQTSLISRSDCKVQLKTAPNPKKNEGQYFSVMATNSVLPVSGVKNSLSMDLRAESYSSEVPLTNKRLTGGQRFSLQNKVSSH